MAVEYNPYIKQYVDTATQSVVENYKPAATQTANSKANATGSGAASAKTSGAASGTGTVKTGTSAGTGRVASKDSSAVTGSGAAAAVSAASTPAASTAPTSTQAASASGKKTIAQMVAESGGKMTPEIALADPNLFTNDDGTMWYNTATGQWTSISAMDVPTYLRGGYALNAQTGEVNDLGKQTTSYADGSGSTTVNGQNQNAQIGSVLQQLGFEEEAKPYLEAAAAEQAAALASQLNQTTEVPAEQTATGLEGATPTTVWRNGQAIQAWILNGRTVDANGNPFSFQDGDIVNTQGGQYIWQGNGAVPYTGPSQVLSPVQTQPSTSENIYSVTESGPTEHLQTFYNNAPNIENSHVDELQAQLDEIRQNMLDMNKATVDKGILDLQAQLENGLSDYDRQRAQAAIDQAKAANNMALRNAALGDRGGIGQKQYSAEQNSYDQQMLAIQLEQINFQNSINQQIAQLEAEGRFQDAQLLAQWGQYTVETLQNEWQYYWNQRYQNSYDLDYLNRQLSNDAWERTQTEDNTKWNRAAQALQLGFLTPQMAQDLGVPEDQAQAFVDRLNLEAQINLDMAQAELDAYRMKVAGYGTSGGSSGGSGYSYSSGGGTQTSSDSYYDTGDYSSDVYEGSRPAGMSDAEFEEFQTRLLNGGVPIYNSSAMPIGAITYSNGEMNTGPLGENLNYYIIVGNRKLYYNPATDDFQSTPAARTTVTGSGASGNTANAGSSKLAQDNWLKEYRTVTGDTSTADLTTAKAKVAQQLGRAVEQLRSTPQYLEGVAKVGGLERDIVNPAWTQLNQTCTALQNLLNSFPQ